MASFHWPVAVSQLPKIPAARARPPHLSHASCPRPVVVADRPARQRPDSASASHKQKALSRHRRGSPATDRTQARHRTPGSPSTRQQFDVLDRSAGAGGGGKPQHADHRDRDASKARRFHRQPPAWAGTTHGRWPRRVPGAGARGAASARRWCRRVRARVCPALFRLRFKRRIFTVCHGQWSPSASRSVCTARE